MASEPVAFPYLLLPSLWSARNRARRRQHGDGARVALFGGIGLVVGFAIFAIVFWLTRRLLDYAELGDTWCVAVLALLTFLSFRAGGIHVALDLSSPGPAPAAARGP
jgi:hypothetical protein